MKSRSKDVLVGTFVLLIILLIPVFRTQTAGFALPLILSNLPNDPRWEVSSLSPLQYDEIQHLLDQRFTFLGAGGWCFAFLGEDGKTVLKFYRHTHLTLAGIWRHWEWQKLFLKAAPWPSNTPYFQEFNFQSCALLQRLIPERTGVIYAHLNKTEKLFRPVTLVDKLGISHTLELDATEFILQQRADLVIPHLARLIAQDKIEEAQQCIQEMLLCVHQLYAKGLRDTDSSFRNNFGYIDHHAVVLDLSSFVFDSTLLEQPDYKKEVATKTRYLEHFLRKYHPSLHPIYETSLSTLGDL